MRIMKPVRFVTLLAVLLGTSIAGASQDLPEGRDECGAQVAEAYLKHVGKRIEDLGYEKFSALVRGAATACGVKLREGSALVKVGRGACMPRNIIYIFTCAFITSPYSCGRTVCYWDWNAGSDTSNQYPSNFEEQTEGATTAL